MTCHHLDTAIVCAPDRVDRLRCRDGRHAWVSDHGPLGPEVTHDRAGDRLHEHWYDDPPVAEAVDWWYRRGRRG